MRFISYVVHFLLSVQDCTTFTVLVLRGTALVSGRFVVAIVVVVVVVYPPPSVAWR